MNHFVALPRLSNPPNVKVINSSMVIVTWSKWNQSTDVGSPGIHSYTLVIFPF